MKFLGKSAEKSAQKSFIFEKRGQVSFEYLLTITFAILLVVVVTLFALNLRGLATSSRNRMNDYKDEFLKNIFG